MPQVKLSKTKKIQAIVKDFKRVYSHPTRGTVQPSLLFIVKHEKHSSVEQHATTSKQKKASQTWIKLKQLHDNHLSMLVNKILLRNFFKLLHQVIYP